MAKKVAKKKQIHSKEELNDQVVRFCDEYLVDFNATRAAAAAGYSKRTAGQQASRLLKNVKVQDYLQSKKQKVAEKLEISRERTIKEIARVAFSDIRKIFTVDGALKPVTELDEDSAAIIASIEVSEETVSDVDAEEKVTAGVTKKVKLLDKLRALEMLAKHFKVYEEAPVVNNYSLNSLSKDDLRNLLTLKQKMGK